MHNLYYNIGKMWYDTKKGILKHLGRNEKSVRSLQRLIDKGVVIEKNGSYIYRGDYDLMRIRKLKAQVEELKKSEGNGGEQLNAKNFEDTAEILKLKGELEEALVNVEYYKGLCKEEIEDKERIIKKCFEWIKKIQPKADEEQFREWINNKED